MGHPSESLVTLGDFGRECDRVDSEIRGLPTISQSVPDFLANVHAEASEAWECHRKGWSPVEHFYINGKPEGIPVELADIVLRIAAFCHVHGINLAAEMTSKLAFNATRGKANKII